MAEKTVLQVEGMTCAHCASTITRALEKKGAGDVFVSFASGHVEFTADKSRLDEFIQEINSIGYKVTGTIPLQSKDTEGYRTEWFFATAAVLTLPLLAHMVIDFHWLHSPFVQLALCLPVLIIGWIYFGKSAAGSLKARNPNMDVLILLGSSMAFVYSITGMFMHYGSPQMSQYLFFETSAAIICFVLLGNVIEQRTVRHTSAVIDSLIRLQPLRARKITRADTTGETVTEIAAEEIQRNDILLVAEGDQIPADGTILDGSAWIDESAFTGEPLPVSKTVNDRVLAGTIVKSGHIKMIAEQAGRETALAGIIRLVKKSQQYRPPIQRLADRISRWFVPLVILIALITFAVNYLLVDVALSQSLMRAIAVLVIACPCAMGLATPTALSAGTGRAASRGILIRSGHYLETLSRIKVMAFDKTGTLTKGEFRISQLDFFRSEARPILAALYSLELLSSHPLARAIIREIERQYGQPEILSWSYLNEEKGAGIIARDHHSNEWKLGSYRFVNPEIENHYDIYLSCNGKPVAALNLEDEINEQAASLIQQLKKAGIKVVLISGDKREKCQWVAAQVGIDQVYSEQMPQEKVEVLNRLKQYGPVAMIGDGINDAGALSASSVAVSFSDASAIAMQSAHVILLRKHQLNDILLALKISKATIKTIRQNLFWAFFYNVLAIPVAAAGYLAPIVASLSMAFSDVIVIGNSLLLRFSGMTLSLQKKG
jgi:Cu+-exporting ATPase